MRDIEPSNYSHQQRLHLDDAIQEVVISVPGRVNVFKDDQRTRIATRGSS